MEKKSKSQFSLKKYGSKQEIITSSQGNGEIVNPAITEKISETPKKKLEGMVQNIPTASSNIILGNVVEKKFHIDKYKFDDNRISVASEMGFPRVYVLDDVSSSKKNTNDNHSLFWQKVLSIESVRSKSEKIQKDEYLHSDDKEETIVVTEDQMVSEIQKENLEKLAQMSEEEILKEKKKLEETFDPGIIQFLKNKRKKEPEKKLIKNNNMEYASIANETTMDTEVFSDKKIKLSSNSNDNAKMDCEDDTSDIPESSKEILTEGKQKGWLHMDTVELDKLMWMQNLEESKKDESTPNKWYNARFDFNGLLLPYKDESLTVDKGLYHHGEELERPGYSLQELLRLSRSSHQSQRCTALTTLAKIMSKTREGWYDKALYPAPLNALSQKNILLLLRFALDDTSTAVVTATLQALTAFLYSKEDELCLDRLYGYNGYVEPTFTPQLEDKDTSSLKDHELAQLDAVAVLLRSDILLRIRYILSKMHPPPVGVKCALKILIRIARHSHITALNISSTPYLMETIVHNFIPLSLDQLEMQDMINNVYRVPVVEAIKLCRVLVVYGKKPVAQKLDNFKVLQAIVTYVNSDIEKENMIMIESVRLWQILLHYEVGLDSVAGAQLILISRLQLHLNNRNIQNMSELSCEYAAALISVASHEKTLKPIISTLLEKWSTQLLSVSNVTWGIAKLIATTASTADEVSVFRTTWLSNPNIFASLRSSSNLLSDCKPATDREPSCLPNLIVLMEDREPQPIMSLKSCIPFLATILRLFYDNSRVMEIRAILEHPSFLKYIRDLEAVEWSLERSWYSRMELHLLTMVVKATSLLGDTIDNAIARIIWKIIIKLVSALPADDAIHVRELLRIALSNEKVNLEMITNQMIKLNLISTVDRVRAGLCADVASLYERYIDSNGDWNQAAMPKDWLFLPLIHIYTKCKSNVQLRPEDKDSIVMVLNLALILPDLIERLSPSLRFSRLTLVYLCDTVYLERDVSVLLASVVSDLLRRYHTRLDLRTEVPGLNSFTDLFTALCEEFCSSSYGNENFAMVLLVPVAQRHDAHYRKLLWSEHAGALHYLRLPLEKLVVPFREYLYPEEEDTSLIECYITALVRGTISEAWCPIPYTIAIHHSAMYLKRSNKLAIRMRTQMEKLRDKDIASKLLQYEPPQL